MVGEFVGGEGGDEVSNRIVTAFGESGGLCVVVLVHGGGVGFFVISAHAAVSEPCAHGEVEVFKTVVAPSDGRESQVSHGGGGVSSAHAVHESDLVLSAVDGDHGFDAHEPCLDVLCGEEAACAESDAVAVVACGFVFWGWGGTELGGGSGGGAVEFGDVSVSGEEFDGIGVCCDVARAQGGEVVAVIVEGEASFLGHDESVVWGGVEGIDEGFGAFGRAEGQSHRSLCVPVAFEGEEASAGDGHDPASVFDAFDAPEFGGGLFVFGDDGVGADFPGLSHGHRADVGGFGDRLAFGVDRLEGFLGACAPHHEGSIVGHEKAQVLCKSRRDLGFRRPWGLCRTRIDRHHVWGVFAQGHADACDTSDVAWDASLWEVHRGECASDGNAPGAWRLDESVRTRIGVGEACRIAIKSHADARRFWGGGVEPGHVLFHGGGNRRLGADSWEFRTCGFRLGLFGLRRSGQWRVRGVL